jgi:hypothetical protein
MSASLSKVNSILNASFDLFRNSQIAIEEAKFFIAWLSTITRKYLDLSHREMGIASSVGPLMASKTSEKIADNQLEGIFHIKLGSENGAFYDVNRPDFSPPLMDEFHKLKMPSDINGYTDKLYNLPRRERDKFFDACFSYQFAQQNFRRTPSVSLVALVNCVEIMMRDEITSGYCKDAGKRCPAKKDVVAKFRKFFERNLVNPLPPERRKFLNSIYRSRSNFVHKALLGEGPLRGPKYMSFGKEDVIAEQLNELEILVNAGLISWLDNI